MAVSLVCEFVSAGLDCFFLPLNSGTSSISLASKYNFDFCLFESCFTE